MALIEVTGLTKRYADRVAVEDLSFEVQPGEVLGFLGPNGAGKSTTMRMLAGFLPPTSGQARIDGYDVATHPMEVKRRLGYLPETPPLYLDMTVRGYLEFVGRLKGVARRALREEVDRVATLTQLTEVLPRLLRNLSKGFRQRTGLAQALLGSPPVLVFDEPTEGLDPRQRLEVLALIRSLAGAHTLILSTHVLSEVMATCHKVLILHRGRCVEHRDLKALTDEAPLEDVFTRLTAA